MKKKTFLTGVAVLMAAMAFAASDHSSAGNQIIRFDTPISSTTSPAWRSSDGKATAEWERLSLPIGNSSIGASVLGSVTRDRLVLNEKTLWHGGPGTGVEKYWKMNRQVPDSVMGTVRALLVDGKSDEAYALLAQNFCGTIDYDNSPFGAFTVLGEASVETGIDEAKVTDYRRTLDLSDAVAEVNFKYDGSDYTRTYFASYPDSVMAWRYTSSHAPQNLTFALDTPQPVDQVTAINGGLLYQGHLADNGMRWALRVQPIVYGNGTVKANADNATITVSGATDAVFLISADTDYRLNLNPDTTDPKAYVGADPAAIVNDNIARADALGYRGLLDSHIRDYKNLYDRVKLNLNPSGSAPDKETPARLADYRAGTPDPALEELFFNFGRYLLIASSRPGSMPANLQGIWSNNVDAPWHADYHNNINVQMNYWPATSTNLLECFEPYTDYIRSLVVPGTATATDFFNARGWTASISANIFGFSAPLSSPDLTWNYNPTAGPWLATQLWDYYRFSGDRDWLQKIGYDIIKESANFCTDMLYKLPDGTLSSSPSYSPEHGPIDLGATYANAVTREILSNAIETASILDTDAALKAEWQQKLDSITPYKIGQYGQLQEWYADIDDPNDQHRHTNHLFGLHPGSSITMDSPKLIEACKQTLRHRGDAATGWSMGWKLNHWARLHDGDHAYVLFNNLLKNGTADNLWDLHPPFQIDGNFGGTAGVAEMLLQSHNGDIIELLPALPAVWAEGNVTGLLARNGYEVDIFWNNGELTKAVLRPRPGATPARLKYRSQIIDITPETTTTVAVDPSIATMIVK